MPSPTPGFVGERLREARQARGIAAVQLSEMLGVSPQAVSSYEHGKKSPSPAVADAIAEKLNFPPHFFARPVEERDVGTVFYRSMAAATKTARTRAEWRLRWLQELTEHLADSVEFPRVNLPDFGVPANPLMIGFEDIESIAQETRKFWMMSADGPIGNMVNLLENQGAVVARDNLGAVTLDSLSSFSERPYVMIGTDKGTCVRWRFDAAHELGHLLLHRNLDPKSLNKATDFKRVESQAHRFAAAFLLPMAAFADEFFSASLDTLRAMKPRWRVSIGMMIKRARDGDLISEDHEMRMQKNYSRRGWRLNEPLDDTMEPETPRLLRSAIDLIISNGGHHGEDLKQALSLADPDIESLCGLPASYLRFAGAPPVSLRELESQELRPPSHTVVEMKTWRPRT